MCDNSTKKTKNTERKKKKKNLNKWSNKPYLFIGRQHQKMSILTPADL